MFIIGKIIVREPRQDNHDELYISKIKLSCRNPNKNIIVLRTHKHFDRIHRETQEGYHASKFVAELFS